MIQIIIPAVIVGVVLLLIAMLRSEIVMGKKSNELIYGVGGQTAPITERVAKVIAKRVAPDPYALDSRSKVNYIAFEFDNGERAELAIKDVDTYGTLIEGDCGMLKYRGKEFVSFERNP